MQDNSAQAKEDDDRIAAALAAVYAYIETEEQEAARASSSDQKSGVHRDFSSWGLASRLEGTRKFRADKSRLDKYRDSNKAESDTTAGSGLSAAWKNLIICLILWTVAAPNTSALERITAPSDINAVAQSNQTAAEQPVSDQTQSCDIAPACPIAPSTRGTQNNLQAGARASLPLLNDSNPGGVVPFNAQIDPLASSCSKDLVLRVLLSSAEQSEIVVPDGAELIDEQNKKLLAVLPPQSKWKISITGSTQSPQLCFTGNCGSVSAAKLIIASRNASATTAAYNKPGQFASAPQVRNSMNPSFVVPLRVSQNRANETYRPVSFSQNVGAAQVKAKAPLVVSPGFILKAPAPNGLISLQGKPYRGTFAVRARADEKPGFQIINLVELEDYLLSVVPSEMPASWNLEGLKAQTIAARSYAIANLGKHQSEGYDLKANTEDQVYLGVQTETENSNRAVAETKGLVLTHEGKTVCAFFHSSGGGHTEIAEHVWKKGVPYLRSVPDFDDQSPHFAWNREIQVANIEESLRKQGKDVGAVLGIFPMARTSSQRLQNALIAGTLQTLIVSGEELRRLFQAPSSVFNIGQAANAYLLAGRGFGHGLGMSQWGAKYLSEQGYNAAQILSYYYKDVAIQPIPIAQSAERSP